MKRETEQDGKGPSPYRVAAGQQVVAALARDPWFQPVDDGPLSIFGRPQFLTEAECAALRLMIDRDARPSSLWDAPGVTGHRTSQSCDLNPHDGQVANIAARIANALGLPNDHGESLQGQRYGPGEEYRAHYDFFHTTQSYWPEMARSGGQRTWTAMIYLSAVEEGGETHFPRCGFQVPPVPGLLLAWNNMRTDGAPNPFSLHAALPVARGRKYVVTRWFRERPWAQG